MPSAPSVFDDIADVLPPFMEVERRGAVFGVAVGTGSLVGAESGIDITHGSLTEASLLS